MDNLKETAIKSVIWSAVDRLSAQLAQFCLGIMVARMVSPSAYGLVAMLSVFISVSQAFVDSGFSNALIQRKGVKESDFTTVFIFNLTISILCYLLIWTTSPYIASFYRQPILEQLAKVVGLNLIINSLGLVSRAKLTIALNFKIQTKISLASVVISGIVAIYFAYIGMGVWAIVAQELLRNTIQNCSLIIVSRWKLKGGFSKESFITLFSYGSKLLCAGILDSIYINLYSIVIGKFFSSNSLGLYNRAAVFAQFPSINLSAIVNRAMFPIICKLQDKEIQFVEVFIKTLRMLVFVITPLMIILCLESKPFIQFVLTDRWTHCSLYLQILCLAYMFNPIMRLMYDTINGKGRSDLVLKAEIIKKICSFILLIATMPFGLIAMCWGLVIYEVLDFIIMYCYLKKVIVDISLKIIFVNIAPALMASAIVVLFLLALYETTSNIYINLFLGTCLGIFVYCLSAEMFKIREWKFIKQKIASLL